MTGSFASAVALAGRQTFRNRQSSEGGAAGAVVASSVRMSTVRSRAIGGGVAPDFLILAAATSRGRKSATAAAITTTFASAASRSSAACIAAGKYVKEDADGKTIDGLFREGTIPTDAGDRVLDCWRDLIPLMEETDELGGLQFLEIRSSLPDELLMYSDKLSMAHSLELRVPYLDRTIVEYVQKLPASMKVRNAKGKWLHKKICREHLPAAFVRRKKRGFAVNVVDAWFQRSLSKKIESYLLDDHSLMYQLLLRSEVGRLLGEHKAGKADNHKLLFSLVVLEEWLRSARP